MIEFVGILLEIQLMDLQHTLLFWNFIPSFVCMLTHFYLVSFEAIIHGYVTWKKKLDMFQFWTSIDPHVGYRWIYQIIKATCLLFNDYFHNFSAWLLHSYINEMSHGVREEFFFVCLHPLMNQRNILIWENTHARQSLDTYIFINQCNNNKLQ